ARRDRAADPRRGADHRGRADHRDGHRDDRSRSRPFGDRRRRHPGRGGRAGDGTPSGARARRHPARRRQFGDRRGEGHPRRVQRAGDLHHRLSGAAADGGAAGADLPHHQTVSALDGEGCNRTGFVLRHRHRTGL
ncbi:MAG: hypothetical protein AVDCRST_MAG91-482, partial [uncultured Sphingomonadaceae bacterium]